MEISIIVSFLSESLFIIVVFCIFMLLALKQGRQTVTNIILGLYLALLLAIEFPYYDILLSNVTSVKIESALMIMIFLIFAVMTTLLFAKILPKEYDEGILEGFWRKFALAIAGTILIMVYSYHVLPVTELITPGSPISLLFESPKSFFYWLVAPIIILYFA